MDETPEEPDAEGFVKDAGQVAPRHTSEQRFSPEMHAKAVEAYNAEIRRRGKEPVIPNPRYELIHRPDSSEKLLPKFVLTFNADSPSAALQIARRIGEQLDIVCDWHDKFTDHWTAMSRLKMDE